MSRTLKSTDTAAQLRKADADQQKVDNGSLAVNDATENTPTATELARDNPEIFGAAEESGKNGKLDRKTPASRQYPITSLTADQQHAVNTGKPLNEPAKTDPQIELGDRVALHTATPIGGQTVSFGYCIGFNAINGNPNIRLEMVDGSRAGAPLEFGGVPFGAAQEERGNFWTWPDYDQGK